MKIAVLFGGNSSERDVSIASGIQVTKSLKEAGHNVLAVDTFRGVLSDAEVQTLLSKGIAPEPPSTHDAQLVKAKPGGIVQPSYFTDADIVSLAIHGGTGEDGTVQAVFSAAVHGTEEIQPAIGEAYRHDNEVMLERYVPGREF